MSNLGSLVYHDDSNGSLLDHLVNSNHITYGSPFGGPSVELLVWEGELYLEHACFPWVQFV